MKFACFIWLLLLSALVCAQTGNTVTTQGTGAPTGACSSIQRYVDITNNNLYFCSNGSWVQANGASGTTINATNNVLPKRSNATTFADSALTDNGTNVISSLAFLVPNGSSSLPGIAFAADASLGFRNCGTNSFCFSGSGGDQLYFNNGSLELRNDRGYQISSTGGPTGSPAAMLDIVATGILGSSSDGSTVDAKGAFKAAAFLSNNTAHFTAQTATKTIYTLCAAAAGGCNVAGQYRIVWYFNQGGTACGTPGTGGVTFALTWVDNAGTHSAVALAMEDSSSLTATGTKFTFQSSNTAAWASGIFNIWSTGASDIQVTNTYTACGVGTGNWELAASAERLQ